MKQAEKKFQKTGKPARYFKDFQQSWSRTRPVIGKAEHLKKGSNPRFIVTSSLSSKMGARYLYERTYCARGEMENRVKEQQLGLFADRTSAAKMHANQLRGSASALSPDGASLPLQNPHHQRPWPLI